MKVTLYNRHDGAWRRTVLKAKYARWSQGFSYSGGRMDSGREESLLLIPCQDGYLPAEEYLDKQDPAGFFTFQPGDGICAGEGPELGSGHLKSLLPGVQIITGVKLHQVGSRLDHWEVTAC